MRHEILLAPEAVAGFRRLGAHMTAELGAGIERHLRHQPARTGRSRIKRLRGLSRPQYWLRVGEIRVFYDIGVKTTAALAVVRTSDADRWLNKVALSKAKDDLSRILRLAEKEEVVITRHGKPAGVLIGFESQEAWFDYRLERHPRFLERIERAREKLLVGRGIKREDTE